MKTKLQAFLRFLISKVFLINLLAAILVSFGVLFFLLRHLKSYTIQDTDKHIKIDWYYGMQAEDAKKDILKKGLRVQIDSVYVDGKEPGTVVKQFPYPTDSGGFKVKEGREISLNVQTYKKPGVTIPKFMETTRRIVENKLISRGLKTTPKYVEHEQNTVLELEYNGRKLKEGDKIPKGSQVTIFVGRGRSSGVVIPILKGKTISEAKLRLSSASLVLRIVACEGCAAGQDSTKAIVYKQNPYGGENSAAPVGSNISVWLTTDAEKINELLDKQD